MAAKNKFVRRLRRELTGSPKKAAMLGLLLAVAIWFWLPLVQKWFGSENGNDVAKKTTTNSTVAEASAESASATDEPAKPKAVNWRQVREWIRSDPMMQPQEPQEGARNPFAPSKTQELATKKAEQDKQPPAVPELTPDVAGLKLRSTVVGSRMKTAMINYRAYHEGQTVAAENGSDRFKLVQIAANYVVLERNGNRYFLKLPSAEMAGMDE